MNKVKQSFFIATLGLRETLTDTRMVLLLMVLGYIYNEGIYGLLQNAKTVQVPLGMFEGFIMCMNHFLYLVLFLMGFIFFLISIPKINSDYIFFVQRAGKKTWLFGEVINIGFVSMIYMGLMAVVSIVGVASYSFTGNVWSDYVLDYDLKYKEIVGGENMPIDHTVYRYDYPFRTALNAFLLMFLCLLVLGIVVLVFSIINKRIIGILLDVVFIGSVLLFENLRTGFMWIFPTSHSVIKLHHVFVFKKSMIPLPLSYCYFIVVEAVLIFVSCRLLKKKNYFK